MLFGVIAIGTLRGCFFTDPQEVAKRDEERKKGAEKKKKDELEVFSPVVQPAGPESSLQYVKPGHWATASQKMRANYRDFVGELQVAVVNQRNNAYPLEQTSFVLNAQRPVLLTSGRPKATESTCFVPQTNQALRLAMQLQ